MIGMSINGMPALRRAGALAALLWAASAQAIVLSDSSSSPSAGASLNAVGMLNIARSDGNWGCSGSLLAGGDYVLTAAHCISGASGTATTNSLSVSFAGGAVTSTGLAYYVDPSWNGSLDAGNDLALVKLSSPVTTVAGLGLDGASAQGSTVELAGYGYTGTGASGYTSGTFGTLHFGYNQYDATSAFYGSNGVSSAVYLYDFDNGKSRDNVFGSLGLGSSMEAMIAPGDSGGPSLVQVNGQWLIAGVHSFIGCLSSGCTPDSSFGQYAGDSSIFANSVWVDSVVAVPEPETWAFMLAGLAVVAAIRRRGVGANAAP